MDEESCAECDQQSELIRSLSNVGDILYKTLRGQSEERRSEDNQRQEVNALGWETANQMDGQSSKTNGFPGPRLNVYHLPPPDQLTLIRSIFVNKSYKKNIL